MKNKNEEILIDLFLSSDDAQNLQYDKEIQDSIKKGNAFLATYRKQAAAEKAAKFKKRLDKTRKPVEISIEKVEILFDKLLNGCFGADLKNKGLGYCRNFSNKQLTHDEKVAILKTLGLLDKDHE